MSDAEFATFVANCWTALAGLQSGFEKHVQNESHWSYDLSKCTLRIGGEVFPITPIGTHSVEFQSWLWAWANEELPQQAREASRKLQTLQQITGFRIFTSPGFKVSENDTHDLVAMSVHCVGGIGFFRVTGTPTLFLAVHQPPGTLASRITFTPVTAADFEELATLRIAAMRESLERVGRFDPERARERLRNSFHPGHSEVILLDGQRVGFYTFRPAADGFYLDHLYIHPTFQSRGVGAFVLQRLIAQADARQLPIRLGALRDSPSNRFYQRHGFVPVAEDEWDIYYLRKPC